MNCLEFRQNLLIEPRSQDQAFIEHAAACPECAREARRALRFEERLRSALDVPKPIGMESRILSARSGSWLNALLTSAPRWAALAAGLLMTLGLAGWFSYHWHDYIGTPSGLELAVLNHILDEREHLHEDRDIPSAAVERLISHFGARIEGDIGRVSFVSRCNIRKYSGVHMVVTGQQGPVTVLMMPGEYLQHQREVRSSRFTGLIAPTGYGSIAVVGEQSEPLEKVVERIMRVVVWDA